MSVYLTLSLSHKSYRTRATDAVQHDSTRTTFITEDGRRKTAKDSFQSSDDATESKAIPIQSVNVIIKGAWPILQGSYHSE